MSLSPSYRNILSRPKQSPVELKEKMRKNYKNKIHKCRGMLMDKLRGSFMEQEISSTLTDIYKSMFKSSNAIDEEEFKVMEEIKKELIQEEFDWLAKEYERSQLENVDWELTFEEDKNVICPVCQKTNLFLSSGTVTCSCCKFKIPTSHTLIEIKQSIVSAIDLHNSTCNSDVQFGIVSDNVYLLCDTCVDMKLIF